MLATRYKTGSSITASPGLRADSPRSFAETHALEGIAASIGSVGDAYNARAESMIRLCKNEAIRYGSPFRTGPLKTLDNVEWVTWYNSARLHSHGGDVPPTEFEASYYADLNTPSQPEMAPA